MRRWIIAVMLLGILIPSAIGANLNFKVISGNDNVIYSSNSTRNWYSAPFNLDNLSTNPDGKSQGAILLIETTQVGNTNNFVTINAEKAKIETENLTSAIRSPSFVGKLHPSGEWNLEALPVPEGMLKSNNNILGIHNWAGENFEVGRVTLLY